MIENELGKALLSGETPFDIQALTASVLRRDRRRIWILGILCVIAWMAVVMVPWAVILPMMAKVSQNQADANSGVVSRQQQQMNDTAQIVKEGTITTFLTSVISMFIAAICTVSLIILSRRATLRQLNARMAEISSQLKLLVKD